MRLTDFLEHLTGVRPSGDGYTAHCPGHHDTRNSLSVNEGVDGRVLVYCHAGCDVSRITTALGVPVNALFPDEGAARKAREPEAVYQYTDESGALLFEVLRYYPKNFKQRTPDGNGGYIWSLNGVRRVLYRLPAVLDAIKRGERIYLVEGEKDVHALESLGFVATTGSGGAGKWKDEYSESLRGADVVILPDNDEPGEAYARRAADALIGVAANVRIVHLPGLPRKGDAADWVAMGGTADALRLLLEEPALQPTGFTPPVAAEIGAWLETPAPEIDWILKGKVHRNSVVGLAAEGGTGKSFALLQIAMSAAIGLPLLPSFVPVRQSRVLCLFGEDSNDDMHRRLCRVTRVYNDVSYRSTLSNLRMFCGQPGPLMRLQGSPLPTDYYRWLEDEVKAFRPDLVIIDPKSQFFGLDENDNDQTTQWYVALRKLFAANPCAVIVSQHVAKARASEMNSGAVRGASANRDDVRAFWSMSQMSEKDADDMGIEQRWRYSSFSVTKANHAARLDAPIWFCRETDDDGTPEASSRGGVLVEMDMSKYKEETAEWRTNTYIDALVTVLGNNQWELTQRELLSRAEGTPFRDAFRARTGAKLTREQLETLFDSAVSMGLVAVENYGDAKRPRMIPRKAEEVPF